MAAATDKLPPALKHAAFSIATLLPGEDEAAFDRLHQSLVAELAPDGALEEHVVANLDRFVWRREHLDVLRIAKLTEKLISAIRAKELKLTDDAVWAKARAKAREELGELSDLAEIGVCEEQLAKEMEVHAKLDEMIDKCLKRLLFLRGLKSMARSAPVARIAHVPAREIAIAAAAEEAHAAD
jgi:hypothetical protein